MAGVNPNQASVNAIKTAAAQYGIDPRAMIAVARVESGLNPKAVGDGGHAFGLFQFNNAGGVITGDPDPGKYLNPSYNALAAARHIATIKGIRGATGAQAVRLIVNKFERPADKAGEISKAMSYYGVSPSNGGITAPTVANGPQTAPNGLSSSTNGSGQTNNQNGLQALLSSAMQGSTPDKDNQSNSIMNLLISQGQGQVEAPTAGNTQLTPMTPAPQTAQPSTASGGKVTSLANPKIIGTPYQGTHAKAFNVRGGSDNYQSENAVDIAMPKGTPVYAVQDGTITDRIGSLGSGGRFAGLRLNLKTGDNAFYYAHLSKLAVKAGEHVKKGQLLGYSGEANGVQHLHFASENGNPTKYA